MQNKELKNNKYYQEYLELKEHDEELAEIFLQGLIQDRDLPYLKKVINDKRNFKRNSKGCIISIIVFILFVIVFIIVVVFNKLNN